MLSSSATSTPLKPRIDLICDVTPGVDQFGEHVDYAASPVRASIPWNLLS
jgi:hypothetical protein